MSLSLSPRGWVGQRILGPSIEEARFLDSDSAAAPSLGKGVLGRSLGAGRQCQCAIASGPGCWDMVGEFWGVVLAFWLTVYDTPSVFRYRCRI